MYCSQRTWKPKFEYVEDQQYYVIIDNKLEVATYLGYYYDDDPNPIHEIRYGAEGYYYNISDSNVRALFESKEDCIHAEIQRRVAHLNKVLVMKGRSVRWDPEKVVLEYHSVP